MKTKLMGLMALVTLLGLSPARAVPMYTYDVDYNVGGATVTGDIVLNCNSCDLTPSDIISWAFTINGSDTLSSAALGQEIFTGPSDLVASPTVILRAGCGNLHRPISGVSA